MVGNINLDAYFRVAQLTQYLNSVIQQADIAKVQINNSLITSISDSATAIGKKVDLYA